ncbi:MAG: glycosyltransferase family 4 protein [Gammaproteobacteria bacterium]
MARRILFLAKRQYMGKDVLADRYGRLFHLPRELSRHGHTVHCVLSDYRGRGAIETRDDDGSCAWTSVPLRRPLALYRAMAAGAAWCEVVIGSSDCLQLILAHRLARRYGRMLVSDLYDNYASFGLARLPGMTPAYLAALADSAVISCVGDCLAGYVRERVQPRGQVVTVNSVIAPGSFAPRPRDEARAALGLPPERALIGICGGLDRARGIDQLYAAIEVLWQAGVDFDFVIAGRLDPACPPPRDARVRNLGNLPFERMNAFYNALDVNVMQYLDNDFGAYCFPQKLHELIASGAVIAAARVGEMAHAFADTPGLLFEPDDPAAIAATLERQLTQPVRTTARPRDWAGEVARLAAALETATG